MSNELEVLFPKGKQIVIGEETVTVTQFKMKHIPLVIELMKKIFDVVVRHTQTNTIQTPQAFTEIAAAGWPELVALVSLNIGKDIMWVDDLDYDKGLELVLGLVEVNVGFFTSKVLPILNNSLIQEVKNLSLK